MIEIVKLRSRYPRISGGGSSLLECPLPTRCRHSPEGPPAYRQKEPKRHINRERCMSPNPVVAHGTGGAEIALNSLSPAGVNRPGKYETHTGMLGKSSAIEQ